MAIKKTAQKRAVKKAAVKDAAGGRGRTRASKKK